MKQTKRTALLFLAFLLLPLLGGLLVFTPKVSAATITVTTTADENNDPGPDTGCSLYEAIVAANNDTAYGGCPAGDGDDTINVPAGTYITDSNPLPSVGPSLTILGDTSGGTIIEGGDGLYINVNSSDQTYLLRHLTIRDSGSRGVDIQGNSGGYTITLDHITVEDNTSIGISHIRTTNAETGSVYVTSSLVQNNGSIGLHNNECQGVGTMYVTNSMVRGNQETGVLNECGHIVMERVTVSGNTSVNNAGGVTNVSGFGEALIDMTNVTVTDNTSTNSAGGVSVGPAMTMTNTTIAYNQTETAVGGVNGSDSPDAVAIYNTLIADNQGEQCAPWGEDLLAASSNLATDGSCLEGNSDFNEDPIANIGLASALADNGGSETIGSGGLRGNVLTLALLQGSPALNAGDNEYCPVVDERNASRPFEGTCDIGAFEAHFTASTNGGAGAGTAETLADTGQDTWLITLAAVISLLAGGLVLQKTRS